MSKLKDRIKRKKVKKRIMVLGTGLVGCFVANKLFEEGYEVSTADINENTKLHKDIWKYKTNLGDKEVLRSTISNEDVIVNALPGFMGCEVLKACMEEGKKVVDFSFMEQDFLQLNELAKKNKGTAVCDFGFAPGICHMWAKKAELYGADRAEIWVGGLPLDRKLEYKAPFSPIDVIEEYTRPARYISGGRIEVEEPFENKYINDSNVGFISDGLRSLLKTSKLDNLVEYTIRYEEHFDKIKKMKEQGLFRQDKIKETSGKLIEQWKMSDDIKDYSYLAVKFFTDNKVCQFTMYDEHDGNNHSMARATGLPVVAMVKLIADGRFKKTGVFAPEHIVEYDGLYEFVQTYLKKNGVIIRKDY